MSKQLKLHSLTVPLGFSTVFQSGYTELNHIQRFENPISEAFFVDLPTNCIAFNHFLNQMNNWKKLGDEKSFLNSPVIPVEMANAAPIQIFTFAPCQFHIFVVLSILTRIKMGIDLAVLDFEF